MDYIALKRLLQQLFHTDAPLFDIGSIVDLILSEPDVGSTIKTDGVDSDPMGFLSVVNIHTQRVYYVFLAMISTHSFQSHPAFATLVEYLIQKTSQNQAFHHTVTTLLSQSTDTSAHVGLIIGERVFNMPPQVMPPSYKMLHEEMGWAVEEVCNQFHAEIP